MRIGPLVFYWRQRPGLWRPVHYEIDQSVQYFRNLQDSLSEARCNLVLVQPWHRYFGSGGIERHMSVIRNYPSFHVAPYLDRFAWKYGFDNIRQTVRFWSERLSSIPREQFHRRDGKLCFGMIGNFQEWKRWNPNHVKKLERAIEREFGEEATIMIDRKMHPRFEGERVQCNMFRHREHLHLSEPTAAVRPGFFHGQDYPDENKRYVPRKGGKKFRRALRKALEKAEEIHIESWNERTEHSNIEECYPDPIPENVNEVPPDEKWGKSPSRYLKIIRQEIERYEEAQT